jgi:hypothetical protein
MSTNMADIWPISTAVVKFVDIAFQISEKPSNDTTIASVPGQTHQ